MNCHIKNLALLIITIVMATTISINSFAAENDTSYIYEDEHLKLCEYKGILLKHRG